MNGTLGYWYIYNSSSSLIIPTNIQHYNKSEDDWNWDILKQSYSNR